MTGFVSHYTNRVDAKGRVSIPAPFRAALAKDGFEGLYCFPSPFQEAVDAGGHGLTHEIQKKLEGFSTLSMEYDVLSTALYGASETLKIDRDGRIVLTDSIRAHTGIDQEVTFVGQGFKFQIWEPGKFRAHREEAMKRAMAVLAGSQPGFSGQAGGAA
ncbi:division/cell wall cluster transcriptional repressor MraZ [Rhodobacteraceae bacterium RKSG542]|uniref:division/cell wall cluster transcriptional repressor MraZ n=1 Tax=Pseudovibrio flavus TaxID=2529854 RepID=UPI0012BC696D|nr:division/cell wall cluster transcriptional repressor MraZ [Pseudovibrio flavus]MTI19136.1 division/cell wall cluster transcriptional repressor MraZ [Pseudovibrio flavus]